MVKVHQYLGGEDGHVRVTFDKDLFQIPVGVNFAELSLVVHLPFGIRGIEARLECIEGFDEGLAKTVLAVFLASIPKACVGIEHKRSILH